MHLIRSLVLFVSLVAAFFLTAAKLVAAATLVVACHFQKAAGFGSPVLALGANTLTNLIPDVYAALDVVSRELTGFIGAALRDSNADRLALNQTLRVTQAPANAAGKNITPAMAIPAAADQTIANKSITLTKARAFPFSWSGEEQRAMNAGPGFLTVKQGQIAQAIRAAANEVEIDLAVAAAAGASRAFGATAGTAPLFTDWAQAKKILDDNGAPPSDRSSIINTTAGVALRSTANLYKVNEGGDASMLRQGVLGNLFGFDIRESAQVQSTTAGTMASATSSSAAFTVGQTVIPLATAGTGVVAAGDIITFANDTNKYVVASVSFAGANPASGDTITLAGPGLRVAQGVATRAITVFGTSTRNIALQRNALALATRLPEAPAEGDLAIMREVITDPRTGLSFELAVYPGYHMVSYEIGLVWGVSALKPEHIAVIVG